MASRSKGKAKARKRESETPPAQTPSEVAFLAARRIATGTTTSDSPSERQSSTAFELLLQAIQPDIDQKLCEMICRMFKRLRQAAQRSDKAYSVE